MALGAIVLYLGAAQLMRYLPPLAKGTGIYHYQLGRSREER